MTGLIDIAHLRRLLAAASPGPWREIPDETEQYWQVDAPEYCVADCCESDRSEADAALIAAAVNALPELLDRLAALERQLDEVHAYCDTAEKIEDEATALRDRLFAQVADLEAKLAAAEAERDQLDVVARDFSAMEARIADLESLLSAAQGYIDRMNPTICWGVECVHQAKALDMVYAREREVDELKAKLAAAEALLAETSDRLVAAEEAANEAWAKRRLYFTERNEAAAKRIAELEAEVARLRGP